MTRDNNLGCGRKRPISQSVSESFGLQKCFGNELQNASEKRKISFVKEIPSSSSASVPTNLSSKELHVPTQNVHCNGTISKETVGMSGSIGIVHFKDSEGKLEDSCGLKVIINHGNYNSLGYILEHLFTHSCDVCRKMARH